MYILLVCRSVSGKLAETITVVLSISGIDIRDEMNRIDQS